MERDTDREEIGYIFIDSKCKFIIDLHLVVNYLLL